MAGERERSECEAPAPGGCVHTHTGTRAYVCTHTQEATIAHFPHRQALPLILPFSSLMIKFYDQIFIKLDSKQFLLLRKR